VLFFTEKDEELQERDDLRKDRAKERQRERNIARAAPDKRLDIIFAA
jgi:SNW domain-containing protein 1